MQIRVAFSYIFLWSYRHVVIRCLIIRAAIRQRHHGHHAYNEAERKKNCHKFFHFKYLLNCYPGRVTRCMYFCSNGLHRFCAL